ncbi:MAG: putative O-glycosylation ligase, exosortase A system-associated [Methylovulum sp.]|nr:putative O-glycosylation ligase, exosortase A system-associated [Methylovulum sp.]
MRDLTLLAVLPLLMFFAFKRPFIGIGLWLWTSAFQINALVYSFASSITYNRFFAIITMLAYFASKNKPKFKWDKISILILIFFIWTTLSSLLSDADADTVWERWNFFMKIILFYFFSIAILERKLHVDFIIWILVLSIGALAASEGLKFIASGGSHRFGYLIGITGDNNFFAVMILTLLPLSFYLVTQTTHKFIKQGLVWVVILMVLGLISTYSRSGFVGLAVLGIFFIKSSKRKVLWITIFAIVISLSAEILPEEWFSRMNTVESAEGDSSFMHRVMVWKMCVLIALNNPYFGGGFKAVENLPIWQKYVGDFYILDFIPTPDADFNESVRASHSIYFQVLSDQGFVGLGLFLLIIASAYIKIGQIEQRAKTNGMEDWVFNLLTMLRLSITVYCISGGTVAIAYFDFFYAVLAIIFVLDNRIVSEKIIQPRR